MNPTEVLAGKFIPIHDSNPQVPISVVVWLMGSLLTRRGSVPIRLGIVGDILAFCVSSNNTASA